MVSSGNYHNTKNKLSQVLEYYEKFKNIKQMWSFYQLSGLKWRGLSHLQIVHRINFSVINKLFFCAKIASSDRISENYKTVFLGSWNSMQIS